MTRYLLMGRIAHHAELLGWLMFLMSTFALITANGAAPFGGLSLSDQQSSRMRPKST